MIAGVLSIRNDNEIYERTILLEDGSFIYFIVIENGAHPSYHKKWSPNIVLNTHRMLAKPPSSSVPKI
jgi:hypothetical protein